MKYRFNKKSLYFCIIFFLIISVGLGYSYINTKLSINGVTTILGNTWGIYFDNVVVSGLATSESVVLNNDTKSISFNANLARPGDEYKFTVDVINGGSLATEVEKVTKSGYTTTLQNFLEYNIECVACDSIEGMVINPGESNTISVSVKYMDEPISYPELDIDTSLGLTLKFKQG